MKVIVIETYRGGRDPDEYAHIVTPDLAAELDRRDPWKTLGNYETQEDDRILHAYIGLDVIEKICLDEGYDIVDTIEAVGY